MKTEWRDIPGYEGIYQASNKGKIRSLDRITFQTKGKDHWRKRMHKGRIMKQSFSGGAGGRKYLTVGLSKRSKVASTYVHHAVWAAFNGWIEEGYEMNHKDGVKTNNRLDNLEICTRKGNFYHAMENGLNKICYKGSGNPRSVLTEDQVMVIKRRIRNGDVQRRIAEDFEVTFQTINQIAVGKTWTHV